MARSWVGLTILACLPCMEMLQSIEAHNSYVNCQDAEECYECAIMSSKNLCQTRSTPTLRHKPRFAYECPPRPYGEGVTWYRLVRRPAPPGPALGGCTCRQRLCMRRSLRIYS